MWVSVGEYDLQHSNYKVSVIAWRAEKHGGSEHAQYRELISVHPIYYNNRHYKGPLPSSTDLYRRFLYLGTSTVSSVRGEFSRLSALKVTGEWRKLHNEELHDLYSSPSIIRISRGG
jgi:hypothetical protein